MKIQKQAGNYGYKSSGFMKKTQELIRNVVIPYQYDILNDRIEGIEKSHVIQNFINAAKTLNNEGDNDGFYGMVFQDSDLAKWIEAAAYSLENCKDEKLEAKLDEVIDIIEAAQDKDGYLNTYYTVKDADKRWTNLCEGHELYCSGHMIEAAVAYYEATGKRKLLDIVKRNADLIYDVFITKKHPGYPGHPEVELALLKLYRATGEARYLELAKYFIDVRGLDSRFFEKESANRGWSVWGSDGKDSAYNQAHEPVRNQKDAVGHSVRAVYLYTAMADIAAEIGDEELKKACDNLWLSIIKRRMYITGGIGSTVHGEAFTVDYNLPNDTTYCETCASIGLMFFASRMLEMEVKGEYADIIERAFYNTVLAGMQLDGKRFFYVNPLEVIPGISGLAATHKHTLPERPTWYACACCPPNVSRTVTSIAKYAYGENEKTAYCHMILAGEMTFENGLSIECNTMYPHDFNVEYLVTKGNGELAIHIPGWSIENFEIAINNKNIECETVDGYVYLKVAKGDKISILLERKIQRMYCSFRVANNTGAVALQRGPLVYCAEGIDNKDCVINLCVKENGNAVALEYDESLLQGIVPIEVDGYRLEDTEELYFSRKPDMKECKVKMVPYYAWGNRGRNQMRVWLPERG